MAGAREGDHHAVDAAEGDQVARASPACRGAGCRAGRARGRRRRCSRPGPARAPGGAAGAARAGARPRPSRGSASARAGSDVRCRPTRAAARPIPAPAPVMTAAVSAPTTGDAGVEQRQQAEDRPRDQQRGDGEARRVADAAGPRAQVVERVQAADVGQHRPAEADRERDDREARRCRGRRRAAATASRDRTRDDVGRQQLAAQLRLPAPGGRLSGYERLSEDVRRRRSDFLQDPPMSHSCSRPLPCSGERIMPRITEYQSPVSGLFPHRHPDRHRTGPQVTVSASVGLRLSPIPSGGPRPRARCAACSLTLPGLATAWLGFRAGGFFPGQVGLVALTLALALVVRITLARAAVRGLESRARAGFRSARPVSPSGRWPQRLWSDAPARALAEFDRTLLYGLVLVADRQRRGAGRGPGDRCCAGPPPRSPRSRSPGC